MGDYDGEIYRSVNDIYGELSGLRSGISTLIETTKQLLDEIKGLRKDIAQSKTAI